MFLGDARSDAWTEKIRPSSLKGALRFWWRALNWGPGR
ncbi:RAMP superfamily CRISPR-associated protein [Endozoicomonas sp. ONNA2]